MNTDFDKIEWSAHEPIMSNSHTACAAQFRGYWKRSQRTPLQENVFSYSEITGDCKFGFLGFNVYAEEIVPNPSDGVWAYGLKQYYKKTGRHYQNQSITYFKRI